MWTKVGWKNLGILQWNIYIISRSRWKEHHTCQNMEERNLIPRSEWQLHVHNFDGNNNVLLGRGRVVDESLQFQFAESFVFKDCVDVGIISP